ncbi:MAG: response regulator transcription factor [Ornithinimicrobium sp.]
MVVPAEVLTVAVINDFEVVVRGVAGLLEPFADELRVVEMDVGTPVSEPVDIGLYDTFAMEGAGSQSLQDIMRNANIAALVFYTWNLSPDVVAHAQEVGVSGVLSKSLSAQELVRCLHRIRDGERVISPEPTPDARVVAGEWPGREYGLTPRESEIVALIAQGLSNKQIVERTFLSINSVKSYIRSAYRTMGVTSRSQAVRWCMERGLDTAPRRISLDRTSRASGPFAEA